MDHVEIILETFWKHFGSMLEELFVILDVWGVSGESWVSHGCLGCLLGVLDILWGVSWVSWVSYVSYGCLGCPTGVLGVAFGVSRMSWVSYGYLGCLIIGCCCFSPGRKEFQEGLNKICPRGMIVPIGLTRGRLGEPGLRWLPVRLA